MNDKRKQNVILILVDDMGYGDFGVFSDGSAQTPNLDKLVEQGVVLTQHYSASPVCAPARAALMTGRYPHRTGAIDTFDALGLDRLHLDEITMADGFRLNGYRTGLIGKWHLGAIEKAYHPLNRGFDEFIGFSGGWSYYYDWRIDFNGTFKDYDGRYLTDVITDGSIDFIKRNKEQPFFLHVTYNAPHFPFQAPEHVIEEFRKTGKYSERLATLYAMIKVMDDGVGKIMNTLEMEGLNDDTLLIFTSDNGPQLHDGVERYNHYFNGEKGTTYEGGIRVPAVIRWNGHLENGGMINTMMHATDWFPTLFSMLNLTMPPTKQLDGVDVSAILYGKQHAYPVERFWQWNRFDPVAFCNCAVRKENLKLVYRQIEEAMYVPEEYAVLDRYSKKHFGELEKTETLIYNRTIPEPHEGELYNIAFDRFEKNDISAANPDIVDDLKHDFQAWFDEVEDERKKHEREIK